MRRELPPRPSLDHLKKQAKDLLDAHRRGDPEALERFRASVPSFAGMSDEVLRGAPVALHDAQSAIAREYGLKSWNELREAVASKAAEPPLPDPLLRALMGRPLPDAVVAALQEARARRAARGGEPDVPASLPLVAMRDALFVPRILAPINVGRPTSAAAIGAALAGDPPLIAVFAQRAAETEDVTLDALHPIGCAALVHARIPDGDARAWVVLETVRWISLQALDRAPGGYLTVEVGPVRIEEGDAGEVPALDASLRATAKTLASGMPEPALLVAILDAEKDPGRLADMVVANLPVPVQEKARYAAEPRLSERLRIAGELARGQIP